MKQRLAAWLARGVLLTVPVGLMVFLFMVPVHTKVGPWGYQHSAGMAITAGIGIAAVFVLGVVVAVVLCMEVVFAARLAWSVAWHQPRIPWRKRWTVANGGKVPKIRPSKPGPLVKGRIGSR